MVLLYLLLRILLFPLLLLYFLGRAIADRRYLGTLGERLGRPANIRKTEPGGIWLHAVSVGEAISSVRLLTELRALDPALPLFVSTATLAGHAVAQERLKGLADGVFYAPMDYAFAVRRVLRRLRPSVVVVLETEIWPVLYREAKRAACGLYVVNGRISAGALPGYRRFRFFFSHVLSWPDAILTQSEQDRERYLAAGAPLDRVRAAGNLKYDAAPLAREPAPAIVAFLARLDPSEVWIAASTMAGADAGDVDEDDAVIDAFRELSPDHPRLLLLLVPRKPERFSVVASKLDRAGVAWVQRSSLNDASSSPLPAVLLVDTVGELAGLFPLAHVVFMGGTLARRGGHNILEPAACGKAVIAGPHLENFAAIASDFREAGALLEIDGPLALTGAVHGLLTDAQRRNELGARGAALAGRNQGVARAAAAEILEARERVVPCFPPPALTFPIRWLLSRIWLIGNRLQRQRDLARARSLDVPVISVGGIGMGGVGKTPFVAYLADRLRRRGIVPAILTRGYRRKSLEASIVIEAGSTAPTCMTGDEAQIFVRSQTAHVGIGADRWSTGRLLQERVRPDVFLLDDGFQHVRLKRQLDFVLIDAHDPFGGEAVFPLGRLREPLAGLGRSSAFVITRACLGRTYAGLRARLHAINPNAPVFLARIVPCGWISLATGQPAALPCETVAAFCGLGNPDAFWSTLRELDLHVAKAWPFDDHHVYSPLEIGRLAHQAAAAGARVLVTTEKDAVNLPLEAPSIAASIDIYWLKIEVQVVDEERLLELVQSKLS